MRLTHSPKYKWIVAAMAFLAVFTAIGLGRNGYSAILPFMQEALGFSSAAAGSLASWNLAGYAIMAVAGGVLASRFGPRIVVIIGLLVTAAGMLFTGLSDDIVWASAARLLTGIGNGLVLAPAIALMAAWFSAYRLGAASGIVPAGISFGNVLVGPLVPRLIVSGGTDGWRAAWYVFAAMTAIICVLTLVVQRDRPYDAAAPRRPRKAVLPEVKAISRSRFAWHLGVIYLFQGIGFAICSTFFQKRLTVDLGYTDETAGSLFVILGVAGIISGVAWGAFSDHFGRGRAVAVMFMLDAIAAGLFALWPSAVALSISAVLLGFCGFGVSGCVAAACGDEFGPVLASASLGFVTVFAGAGQAIGPYIGGLMEDAFSSLAPSYLLAAGFYVLAAFVAHFLRDARPVPSLDLE